jgi:hypothetical protein
MAGYIEEKTMHSIKDKIKQANHFADEAIKEAERDLKEIGGTMSTWLNAGNYHLTNVHVVTWLGITVILCIIF